MFFGLFTKKKRIWTMDLHPSRLAALDSFSKVYEVLYGRQMRWGGLKVSPRLLCSEPVYENVRAKIIFDRHTRPTLYEPDKVTFIFEYQEVKYHLVLRFDNCDWYASTCEIQGEKIEASADFHGYGEIIRPGLVIHLKELDTGKEWHIEGTSSKHRVKITPEELASAEQGMEETIRLIKARHKI